MLRGSSQIRLSQLDVAPIVQAAQVAEAADVNLSNAVNQSILDFTQKQEQKKQEKIAISSIQNLLGIDDPNLAKSIYKDEIVRDAFVAKQKADADIEAAKVEAENERLTQGAYYLSQLPAEMRVEAARTLGLPLPPEPEVKAYDYEGFETRIFGVEDKKLGEQLEAIKNNPDNPQNATALQLLGMPADAIPSYLESLKTARTEKLTTDKELTTDEVVEEESDPSLAERALYSPVVEAPLKLGAEALGQFVDVPAALVNLAKPESERYKTVYTPDAPVTPSLGSEGLKQILSRTREGLIVPTLKALGFIED